MSRACKLGLDLVSQKNTYSTGFNLLKRQPPNEKHQVLPYYIGEYEPRQNNTDIESATKILIKEDDKMVVKRRFEKICNMMESKSS